jgi:ABC-type polysaccharide/polyol phosphate transport system ATPase subunit
VLDGAALVKISPLLLEILPLAYTSGMPRRLGFSIATQVRADIYPIDEMLAVGDQHFKHKCHARLAEERRAGRTIRIATHDLSCVEKACDRAALPVRGRVKALGQPDKVVRHDRDLMAAAGP